ncbi:MAG: glycyl-radical enzyme activating protein [Firmicutes bacterium]|nr:glycyl-radical enzyme activating protein [Bacillota bacterium]
MIFNIQKCSVHDGNGLRTLVFFKGCPLRCLWCANPESQAYGREITEIPRKCIACDACQKACPESAISLVNGEMRIDRSLCKKCFKCTEVCYAGSKEIVGEEMDVETLFHEINKDRLFYKQFGGGVTFSGGEPLTQPSFLAAIAKKCREHKINTTVETCGYGNYEEFSKALPYIDSMFIDVKHMDAEVHKRLTGVSNEVILSNIRAISTHGIPVTIRTPVIPGYNDSEKNIGAIASFISTLPNVQEYELLPYHNLGASKYASLGLPYALEEVKPPTDEEIIQLVKLSNHILKPYGKQCFYTKKNKKEIVL